ncbi:MAG: GNAT family N-acetyltransferase [Myxococcaceae bacterium]
MSPRTTAASVEVVPYAPELKEHFYRINVAWLRQYFQVEPIDERVLSSPETEILEPGGAILFARLGGEIVGTCALMRDTPGCYELTKMGVDQGQRGLGIGRVLIDAAVREYERREGRLLFLETNSILTPAIRLYESVGFVHRPRPRPSHYARGNVYMEYAPS